MYTVYFMVMKGLFIDNAKAKQIETNFLGDDSLNN